MTQVRFATVQDLFEAYPTARHEVGPADASLPSMDFLRATVGRRDWPSAVSFCAYLLPRRVAVAWGCRALRQMVDRFEPSADRAIRFAEAWVHEPDESHRSKALAAGNANDYNAPTTWLALAAGFSGGSVVPPEYDPVEAKPEQTAKAVRAAILIALCGLARDSRDQIMTACLEDGIQLARGEPRSSR
ncbi:DUF6931 family protein [Bradyrhizobium lablabi]|uniref:DUF6931 family protein n=1 Tax=Bradyrhizobium lablabi TaxID=722472 RepID=UPI001BAD8F45|nr:hypothetical protein [Bradyrhizobium lablabi]MBR0694736.1 hypothetical protein [Bradyrhizobium lablabi]